MNAFQANKLALYFIAGTQDLAPNQTLPELLEKAIRGGITAFQYREKGPNSLKDAHALEEMARTLQVICRKHQVLFFINDDLELALTIQADGVHVGQTDQPIQEVIARSAGQLMIGLSCHQLAEVHAANDIPEVDYVGIGPVFKTSSKSDAEPPLGIEALHVLAVASTKPVVAIGGLTPLNISAFDFNTITGIALISALTQSDDIAQTLNLCHQAMHLVDCQTPSE